jgi:diguanylate cyclase (GGDEF)-like protein/PAS domain S-box-containing protein
MVNARILIAGDEAIVAEDLRQTLVELGYGVAGVVFSGEEVVAKAEEAQPDLVLMDISLGGKIDGITAAEQLHTSFDTPVIYLTVHTDDDTFQRAKATDPFAYLLKPFDPDRLRYAIELALYKHKLVTQLKESERLYRAIFEACGSAILIVEEDGTISMVNEEFQRLSGYAKGEMENWKPRTDFLIGCELAATEEGRCTGGTDTFPLSPQCETLFIDREGCAKTVYTHVKVIPGTRRRIVSIADITGWKKADTEIRALNAKLRKVNSELRRELAERKNAEKHLVHKASHDSLTGLPNRDLFMDRLQQALAFAARHNSLFAVMLLDVDDFKSINDTMGHMAGDLFLKEVAKRLRQSMRQYDTVARFGGDEFVVIANDMKDIRVIAKFAEKLHGLFRQPFIVNGESRRVSVSIGVAVSSLHGAGMETLLKKADMAMYQAKNDGKNVIRFFAGITGNPKEGEGIDLKRRLLLALEREEFLPHYQPRVDATTGKITGMEALIRWQPKGVPLVYPAAFFPLLEESGLIVPLGEWLLDKVCRQAKAWQDAGLPPLRVSVNISARQFQQEDFEEKVAKAIFGSGLDPRYLEIELAEKIMTDDLDASIRKLKKLKGIGVTISIDNFGIGQSSLDCLNRLPIDELKLDRSLIYGITSDPKDATVVTAAIAMGHGLGKLLVAGGVESAFQYEFLAKLQCEGMQGYFFSKPLPSADFERLVRQERPLATLYH